ncbi:aminotransferase class V-fold PLP-dependent enzyme [Aquibacillus halophilus]|uniref:Aminotransferase class V-fold PLP-dependent enzyme n=2 Tax=Aquibacillus halophilus TaxID=930132 RepID=A0A6A8D6K5_9BACI|nr:aminotransferase class V-fold PLP-dependent enzyme [Aquibacillus halophilus]
MSNTMNSPVFPSQDAIDQLEAFHESLPDYGAEALEIIKKLHRDGAPATVAQTGGRYFGFVNGGIVPAALATKWLTDTWDQNAAMYVMSPVASVLEEICEQWLVDLLGLPDNSAAGFVSGSSLATLCGLAAGRNTLLQRLNYDVASRGLFGAPEIRVVLSEQAHSTVFKALSLLGLGTERLIKVPADEEGRILIHSIPKLDERTLLILQAGNVSSGAFDDFTSICEMARKAGTWVHIDGAFGLWAAASEPLKHLTKGIELADSWSVDAHKTLNAPYDNGIVLCRHRKALGQALSMSASYLEYSQQRDGMKYTPDASQRARAVDLWATLKSLGKQGVSELVEDLHQKALYFSRSLEQNGFIINNKVCFNQVLVSMEDENLTKKTLELVQNSGECWCGGATWKGKSVIRISVSSYRTDYKDIDRSVAAFVQAKEVAVNTP